MKPFQNISAIEATRISSHASTKPKPPERLCEVCKGPYQPRQGNTKTCGPVCGETMRRINERTRRAQKQVPA